MKSITLADFLTDAELALAAGLGDRKAVRDQIIIPNMSRINTALGQENDPNYLSYAVEYIMRETHHWRNQ